MRPVGEVLGAQLSIADILAWDKADPDQRCADWEAPRLAAGALLGPGYHLFP